MKKIMMSLLLALVSLTASAEGQDTVGVCWDAHHPFTFTARLGYSIGGTAPLPMPATIRGLNSYTLQPNISLGVDATKHFSAKWGALVGLRFENKGMKEDAEVKNYHEAIVRGGEELAGQFTGDVTTKVRQWMFTIPVQAVFSPSRKVDVRFGPYVSVLVSKGFEGYAHNGYLRQGDPTGPKVMLGDDKETRGDYDFDDEMRPLQFGLDLGADWRCYKRLGVYADLSWGLTGVHKSSFKTIEQTLYPIFGTIGVSYLLGVRR